MARVDLARGEQTVVWDGRQTSGASVAPGIYFCRVEAGDESATGRLLRVR